MSARATGQSNWSGRGGGSTAGSAAASPRAGGAAALQKRNDFLEMENKRMGQQMHDLSEQNADLKARVDALDSMAQEFEKIVAMDEETREHTVKHIEEHNAIADEHAQLVTDVDKLRKTLARKERALESSEERKRELATECVQVKASNLALAQTVSEQEEELDVLHELQGELDRTVDSLELEVRFFSLFGALVAHLLLWLLADFWLTFGSGWGVAGAGCGPEVGI